MKQESQVRNPFMLMLQPDVVVAAMERSEKLGRLNRRLCHPLDRPAPPNSPADAARRPAGLSDEDLDD
jgi:hypothetical protein